MAAQGPTIWFWVAATSPDANVSLTTVTSDTTVAGVTVTAIKTPELVMAPHRAP